MWKQRRNKTNEKIDTDSNNPTNVNPMYKTD